MPAWRRTERGTGHADAGLLRGEDFEQIRRLDCHGLAQMRDRRGKCGANGRRDVVRGAALQKDREERALSASVETRAGKYELVAGTGADGIE